MRWIPLQDIKSRQWKLCVLLDDCMSYEVTNIESEHVERILSYAAYLNHGSAEGIDSVTLVRLSELKSKYQQQT